MKEIKGNFDEALDNMLVRLTLNEYSKEQILNHWDNERGNDWYVGTLKDTVKKPVLKGRALCKALLERGDTYITCFVSNKNEATAELHRNAKVVSRLVPMINSETEFHTGYDSNGEPEKWKYVVPINNKGEVLTQEEAGLGTMKH